MSVVGVQDQAPVASAVVVPVMVPGERVIVTVALGSVVPEKGGLVEVTSQEAISELKSVFPSLRRVIGTVVSRMILSWKIEEMFPARSLNLM